MGPESGTEPRVGQLYLPTPGKVCRCDPGSGARGPQGLSRKDKGVSSFKVPAPFGTSILLYPSCKPLLLDWLFLRPKLWFYALIDLYTPEFCSGTVPVPWVPETSEDMPNVSFLGGALAQIPKWSQSPVASFTTCSPMCLFPTFWAQAH